MKDTTAKEILDAMIFVAEKSYMDEMELVKLVKIKEYIRDLETKINKALYYIDKVDIQNNHKDVLLDLLRYEDNE